MQKQTSHGTTVIQHIAEPNALAFAARTSLLSLANGSPGLLGSYPKYLSASNPTTGAPKQAADTPSKARHHESNDARLADGTSSEKMGRLVPAKHHEQTRPCKKKELIYQIMSLPS